MQTLGEALKLAIHEERQNIDIEVSGYRGCYSPPCKGVDVAQIDSRLRDVLRAICKGLRPWPLFMYGDSGSGKSYIGSHAILRYGGWHINTNAMVEMMQQAMKGELYYESGYQRSRSEVMDAWAQCNVGVLDEIGERKQVTESHYDLAKQVVDLRDRVIKPTVYISNRDPEELVEIYGDPFVSRISRGTVIEINGDKRRGEPTRFEVKQ